MIVILHNIRGLHNVGSIFRTADGIGAEKIYLCGITPRPVDVFENPREKLVKVSLGAEKYLSWEKTKSAFSLIDKLKKEKYKIFAIEQSKKSIPYFKLKLSATPRSSRQKIALVLGNEVSGLPSQILKKADKILEIPMRGEKESLNVSVAFGIVAYSLIEKLK